MATPQPAILANLTEHQRYVHLSRAEGADLAVVKKALRDLRAATAPTGVKVEVNTSILFGLRERMEAIYGMHGEPRDALTDYPTPTSGSFYFAPSVETLEAAIA